MQTREIGTENLSPKGIDPFLRVRVKDSGARLTLGGEM